MVEPLIHLLFHHPFSNHLWQDISEHGPKPGVEHHVPGVATFRDPTHDPGAVSGADEYLVSRKECCLSQGIVPFGKDLLCRQYIPCMAQSSKIRALG